MKAIYNILLIILLPSGLWAQSIVAGEYYIDEDLGFGQNEAIEDIVGSGNDITIDFNVDLENQSEGLHTFGLRVRDENGVWSLVTHRIFLVSNEIVAGEVVAAEYFIDVDKGFGENNDIEISSSSAVDTLDFSVMIDDTIPPGVHILYVRTQDSNGKWSLVTQRAFVVADEDGPANIVALNYYYYDIAEESIAGEDMYTYPISIPAPIIDLEFPAIVEPLENGKNYIMYVWATDDKNRSSLVTTTDITPYLETIPISIDTIVVNNLACAGEGSGNITVEASGGTGELLYSVSTDSTNYTSSNVFEGLEAGTYMAYVRGNVDGYVESQAFTITAPEPLVLEAEAQGVNCASDANGQIVVTASGGAGEGYMYSLNDSEFQESNTFTGLVADNYTITVRDANGCTEVLEYIPVPFQQQAPAAPTVRRSDESDQVDELSLIAEGFGSGVNLQWYKDNEPIPGATDNTIPVTEAGSYYVIASNGSCESLASNEISITGLSEIIAQQIKLYPVPANDRLKLEIPPQLIQGDISVQLISSSGQILSDVAVGDNRHYFDRDVDISVLPKGIYFMMIRGEDMVVRKKFSKQ